MPPPVHREDDVSAIDLSTLIRPGDVILWGQGTAEPRTLTEALVEQRGQLGGVTVLLGATFSDTLAPEHADHLRFVGFSGIGRNAALIRAGVLDVLPCHMSAVPGLLESRRLPVDVVFVQLSRRGPDGRHSFGLVADYVGAAISQARIVIAEVNDQVPYMRGDATVERSELDVVIETSRAPVFLETPTPDAASWRIGELLGELVPDRAVVQLGIGSVPHAAALSLRQRQGLALHGGLVGDWVVDLMESGAVDNRHKAIDAGVTVTGAVFGSRRLYDYVHDNPAIELHPISYTHSPAVLARLEGLTAINTAIEIDLSGQVNAETVAGRYVGAVGGQVDFVRAAMVSPGGQSVIALPSTARGGTTSRIVARLSDGVVTTPRSDADVVVTEHGVAHLRGVPVAERARRLIAIADPAVRGALADELEQLGPPAVG